MDDKGGKQTKKLRVLVVLWLVASMAALVMPLFDLAYLHPSLVRVLSINTERDARRMANSALTRLIGEDEEIDFATAAFRDHLDRVRTDLGLLRVTMMDRFGGHAQSTAPQFKQRLGLIHLRQVLTSGKGMSRGMRGHVKDQNRADKMIDVMVLTTPIKRDGLLMGALEVVYDWTEQRQTLEALIGRATSVMLLIPLLFLSIVAFVAYKAFIAVREQEKAQNALEENNAEIAEKHRNLRKLFQQIEHAKEEWQVSMDCIDQMVLLVDAEGLIRRCNQAFRDLVGKPYGAILGKNWQQALSLSEAHIDPLSQSVAKFFHAASDRWFELHFYPYKGGDAHSHWHVITIVVTPVGAPSPSQDRTDPAADLDD